jgi:thiol:disulfide interchange protein DsbC
MRSIKFAIAITVGCATFELFAQSNSEMLMKVRAAYPATQIQEVLNTPITGIYEIRMGNNVAFTDSSARYLIFGAMFDAVKQEVLTVSNASRNDTSASTQMAFPHESLGNALRTVNGNGSRVLAVFSDPQCGYCRMLEGELAKLNDVTIYTFMYASLGEASKRTAANIWCAENRNASWARAIGTGHTKPSKSCDHPIEKNLALGAKLGVRGTPTLLAINGNSVAGYRTANEIESWLAEVYSTKK